MKCLLISDFNLSNLAAILSASDEEPRLDVLAAPFGQVQQLLAGNDHECWRKEADTAIIWTLLESVSPSFARLSAGAAVEHGEVENEVRAFAQLVAGAAGRARHLLIPTWVRYSPDASSNLLDMDSVRGISFAVASANVALAEALADTSGVHLIDAGQWFARVGVQAWSEQLRYMAKVPFSNELFSEASRSIRSALTALDGKSRRLIILDLDDTLWGGIVGDAGWENITLGGHDHVGEAFVDFQRALLSFKKRGILLAIASKNEETIAFEAIDRHPEMVLRRNDFAGWRINWQDKAQNIADLVSELNLGLQSVVFIDDNPTERARVREALPKVMVPDWPADKVLYRRALLELDCFNTASVSAADAQRTEQYQEEQIRRSAKSEVGSLDEWLKSLDMKVTVSELSAVDTKRACQLLNKSNQMNLSTRRLSEDEVSEWTEADGRSFKVVRVSDRFGDSGLTGILSVEQRDRDLHIVDFVLSCRVMGRRIEHAMLHVAVEYARGQLLERVVADYLPTEKNAPCLQVLSESGFATDGNLFTWATAKEYPLPTAITLVQENQ